MPAPIAVFAFNRPDNLLRTLLALAANTLATESDVIIFCDGPRTPAERVKTDAVQAIAAAATGFHSCEVRAAACNLGLKRSILDGVTSVINDAGRVIVLEDDLLTAPFFLQFMNDGLDVYAQHDAVASIVGWTCPHEQEAPETFFLRGADCWGWGTWKRAWDAMDKNAEHLVLELSRKNLIDAFNADGHYAYFDLLRDVAAGHSNSWAILWHASNFVAGRYSLFPAHSLVFNDGFTSGAHFSGQLLPQQALVHAVPIAVREMPIVECTAMRYALNQWLVTTDTPPGPFRAAKRFLSTRVPVLKKIYHSIKQYGK